MGTYLGVAMVIIGLAGLTGAPICGAMINQYHEHSQAAIFNSVVVIAGALCSLMAKLSSNRTLFAKV
jgi:predicted MFS family arabinose efflux permease